MTVVSVGHTEALRAFNLAFDDLEDAMQAATAEAAWADFIVTRDKNDYAASPVQALTPDEFIARFSVSP